MAPSLVARLVPLAETLDRAIPLGRAVNLSEGPNQVGREVVSVPDKRLSRKHLTLTVSSLDGSASLFVEGSNPVVVNSGKERRKIRSGERAEIKDGTSDDVQCYNGKRSRKLSEDHFPEKRARNGDNDGELIHHFNDRKQMLPMTFRLLRGCYLGRGRKRSRWKLTPRGEYGVIEE